MASMTVRELDEDVKRLFVERARRRGMSAEALLREVVRDTALAEDGDEAKRSLAGLRRRIEREAAVLPPGAQAEIDEARDAAAMWRASEQSG